MAGLYVHLPSRQNRPAQTGDSSVGPQDAGETGITEALSQEACRYARPLIATASVSTLYLGGEQPSLLSPDAVQTFLDTASRKLAASTAEEVTVEVGPADAAPEYLTELRRLGVTRLSISGISLVSDDPAMAGAQAPSEEIVRTIRRSRAAGFPSFSVDLQFGGAEHPLSHWKTSLQRAVELRLPHVTLHERNPADASDADRAERARRLAFAMTFLRAKGYEQYELTHFARPGHRSHYQEHVYAHGNYLGLGPGAESFWWPDRTDPSTAERWSNVTDEEAYVQRLRNDKTPVAHRESLDRTALAHEYILLRLRTREGLDLNVLDDQYGCSLYSEKSTTLNRLTTEGLIHDDPDRVRLTDRGRLLTDAITQRLIREA